MTKKVIIVGDTGVGHSVSLSALRNHDKEVVFIEDIASRETEDCSRHLSIGVVDDSVGLERGITINSRPIDLIPDKQQLQDILTGKEERRNRRKDLRKRKFKIRSIK